MYIYYDFIMIAVNLLKINVGQLRP